MMDGALKMIIQSHAFARPLRRTNSCSGQNWIHRLLRPPNLLHRLFHRRDASKQALHQAPLKKEAPYIPLLTTALASFVMFTMKKPNKEHKKYENAFLKNKLNSGIRLLDNCMKTDLLTQPSVTPTKRLPTNSLRMSSMPKLRIIRLR